MALRVMYNIIILCFLHYVFDATGHCMPRILYKSEKLASYYNKNANENTNTLLTYLINANNYMKIT